VEHKAMKNSTKQGRKIMDKDTGWEQKNAEDYNKEPDGSVCGLCPHQFYELLF
jgi:hypothetical protein